MAYQLKADEMLHAMIETQHPRADHFKRAYEALATLMAEDLADEFSLDAGDATFDGGMVAAPFYSTWEGQPLPHELAELELDNEEEFGPR